MLVRILTIAVVFCNFEDLLVVDDLEVAECVDEYLGEVFFDDLLPIVQVVILKVVDQLYFAVLTLITQHLHNVLVESLHCGCILGTCRQQVSFQLCLVEVDHIAILLGLNCLPDELVHGHTLLLQDVPELVVGYTPPS